MILERQRRTEDHHQRVAVDLVHRATVLEAEIDHDPEVFVQRPQDVLGCGALRERREAPQIAHEDGHLAPLTAHIESLRIVEQRAHHLGRHVAAEEPLQELGRLLELCRLVLGATQQDREHDERDADDDAGPDHVRPEPGICDPTLRLGPVREHRPIWDQPHPLGAGGRIENHQAAGEATEGDPRVEQQEREQAQRRVEHPERRRDWSVQIRDDREPDPPGLGDAVSEHPTRDRPAAHGEADRNDRDQSEQEDRVQPGDHVQRVAIEVRRHLGMAEEIPGSQREHREREQHERLDAKNALGLVRSHRVHRTRDSASRLHHHRNPSAGTSPRP